MDHVDRVGPQAELLQRRAAQNARDRTLVEGENIDRDHGRQRKGILPPALRRRHREGADHQQAAGLPQVRRFQPVGRTQPQVIDQAAGEEAEGGPQDAPVGGDEQRVRR